MYCGFQDQQKSGTSLPWEERMEEAYERKTAKCQPLLEKCRQRGWKTFRRVSGVRWAITLESLQHSRHHRMTRRRAIADVCRQVEADSQWLWQKRDQR